MQVSLADVQPYLGRSLTSTETTRAESMVAAMAALLTARYGTRVAAYQERTGTDLLPLFRSYIAAAIERKLAKKNQLADSENAGPFAVRWNTASSRGGWFLPEELAELDGLLGMGGTRTYRTPAPDNQRYANLHEVSVPEEIELPWPGGHHV